MQKNTVRLQVQHDFQPNSNPYEPDVESQLDALKKAGLIERGWDKSGSPGIIRHETGPEIIVMVAGLLEIAVALVHLFQASKKHHPETTIQVVVSDPADLEQVLAALGRSDGKTAKKK
jgi:hypothetical protein